MLRVFFVLETNWTCFEILCPKIIVPSQRVVRVFFDLGFLPDSLFFQCMEHKINKNIPRDFFHEVTGS